MPPVFIFSGGRLSCPRSFYFTGYPLGKAIGSVPLSCAGILSWPQGQHRLPPEEGATRRIFWLSPVWGLSLAAGGAVVLCRPVGEGDIPVLGVAGNGGLAVLAAAAFLAALGIPDKVGDQLYVAGDISAVNGKGSCSRVIGIAFGWELCALHQNLHLLGQLVAFIRDQGGGEVLSLPPAPGCRMRCRG